MAAIISQEPPALSRRFPASAISWLGASGGQVRDRGNKVEPEPVGSGRQRGYKFRGNLSLERLIADRRRESR